ncbi:MAG: D-glycero-beta-D-manno-heptose-7-phosphate kinase [Pseudomonadota bacterium]
MSDFAQCRVLCIGDVMLDKFVYGSVERISPEAPIPVFSMKEEKSMLGGAGNVARNLTSLGAKSEFISLIGNDASGYEITAMIGKEKNIIPRLISESGRVSTVNTRYVSGNQQLLRADKEVKSPISEQSLNELLTSVKQSISEVDIIILSDYGKGLLTREATKAIIAAANAANKPIIVDPKSKDFSIYAGATLVSPNLLELGNASTHELKGEKDIVDSALALMNEHNIANILVTRSKDGMTLVSKSEGVHHIHAKAHEVFDVSGAGDTAISTLALAMASGLTIADSARLANLAAGIVVGKPGTAVVTPQDLKTELLVNDRTSATYKIMSLGDAAAQTKQWQNEGKKVCFTNGCFDLMHSGHLTLLNRTKLHGDKLVVGVNADASVKRLKGKTRPINDEIERALLLASLAVVDIVVIFSEDTPLELIGVIKPDVLAKGADYQKHQVVGHELVESYGGEVVLIPLKEGYSTTNIIKKLS